MPRAVYNENGDKWCKHCLAYFPQKSGHWTIKNPRRALPSLVCKPTHNKQGRDAYKTAPESKTQKNKQWVEANREKYKDMVKQYYLRNKDKYRQQVKRWCSSDKGKEYRIRFANRPAQKIGMRIRSRIRMALIAQGTSKSVRTEESLGCTVSQARTHLESLFLPGMSWENIGLWHIDHIRPCASFDLTDPDQQKQCFHYTNLQPLWASDNLSKGAKYQIA